MRKVNDVIAVKPPKDIIGVTRMFMHLCFMLGLHELIIKQGFRLSRIFLYSLKEFEPNLVSYGLSKGITPS